MAYCTMRAFVIFVVIAVASGLRDDSHRVATEEGSLPPPRGGRALGAAVHVIKNAKPSVAKDGIKKAILNGIETVKPQRILAPKGPVPKVNAVLQNLAVKNVKPPAAENGVMKAIMNGIPSRPPAAENGVMKAIMNGIPSSKPPSTVVGAVTRMVTGAAEGYAGMSDGTGAHREQPGPPRSLSDAAQSDNPLAVAGQDGSGTVKIAGVDVQFGTEAAKAAIDSMNWVPSSEDANKILKKLECWPGQPPCEDSLKRVAADWVKDYVGSYKYAKNVCRATRGDLALTSEQEPSACFAQPNGEWSMTTEKATSCAFEFGAGLTAALALDPPIAKQPLYRGTVQPVDLVKKLEGLAGGKETFVFPGVSSTTSKESHAKAFLRISMQKAMQDDQVRVLYTIRTDRAKSVRTALEGKGAYREEWEFILPPGQNFNVESVERLHNRLDGDHYRVVLEDPY